MVACEICGKELKAITWQHLHFVHNMKVSEYLEIYPEAKVNGMQKVFNGHVQHGKTSKNYAINIHTKEKDPIWYENVVNSIQNGDPTSRALKAWETKRKNGTDIPWNYNLRGGICSEIAAKAWLTKHENGTDLIIGRAISKGGFRKDLDHYFRSRWEANLARVFNYLRIRWFYEIIRFPLNNCSYCPDFYLPDFGVYVEVKGYKYKESFPKLRQFLELYPDIPGYILDGEGYKMLGEKFSHLISNWEGSTSKKGVRQNAAARFST